MASLSYYDTETPKFVCTLTDGATNQYPLAYVYNYDLTAKETVTLTHNARGQYIGTASSNYSKGNYSVVYIVYSDSGHTTPNTDYWIAEDNLFVIFRNSNSVIQQSGGKLSLDLEKIAKEVWEYKTANSTIDTINKIEKEQTIIKKMIEYIKDKIDQIAKNEFVGTILTAITGIKFPKQQEFSLTPLIKNLKEESDSIKNEINIKTEEVKTSIKEIPLNDIIKTFQEEIKVTGQKYDYGSQIARVIVMLEEVKKKEYDIEFFNVFDRFTRGETDLKKVKEMLTKLEIKLNRLNK